MNAYGHDEPQARPLRGQTTDGDFTYAPLAQDELRAAVGVATDDYDTRLSGLQLTAVQEVESALGMPPATAQRTDRYDCLAPLVRLSAPASAKPRIYYGATDAEVPASRVELRGPKIAAIDAPPNTMKASAVYDTDVSAASAVIREAVLLLVQYRFRSAQGQDVAKPDIDAMLSDYCVIPVAFG